jgi:dynein heavy chain
LKEWTAYKELKLEIDNLKEVLPIIIDLKKPSIKARHWNKICEITEKTLNYDNPDNFFVSELI